MKQQRFSATFVAIHITATLLAVSQLSPGIFPEAAGDDWPAWRGLRGDGISRELTAPLTWSPTENIAWRVPIPGRGRSSPIVSGSCVFVTTGVEEDQTRRVLCVNRDNGATLWNVVVHSGPGGQMHRHNTMASSTPTTDGEHVFAAFVDDQGMTVVALDLSGNIVWKTSPGTYFSNHGFAASPVICGSGIVVNGHQDGSAFVVLLDRSTGAELWRYTPAVNLRSFSTPILTNYQGQQQLILVGSSQTAGLDPDTGKLIWSVDGPSEKFVCTPSVGFGMVFSFGGSPEKKALAVRLGGAGNVSETHVAWRHERSMPYVPSPLLVDNYMHIVNDMGIYTCMDPTTGDVLHTARALGSVYSSPIAAASRVYLFEDSGRCTIIENRPGFHVLARNELAEEVYTTPAVSDGSLFVRTNDHLIRISEP